MSFDDSLAEGETALLVSIPLEQGNVFRLSVKLLA